MQAQELWSGEWSIAARSTGLDLAAVQDSVATARILRTWPLRGTIHFVPARDAHWMLDLILKSSLVGVERRREFLGLRESDALDAIEVLRAALRDAKPRTRSDCLEILGDAGLFKDPGHAYHLLWFASQHGATAIGPQAGKEQTFVNLDSWVEDPVALDRDESLKRLAYRYFDSHGPSTRKEFSRWTGLPGADVSRAMDLAGEALLSVPTELGEMIISVESESALAELPLEAPEPKRSVLLLGGFDEYILGYGDRQTMATKDQLSKIVPGNNGIFRPTVVDDGRIVGTWKRVMKKTRVVVEVSPFESLNKRQSKSLERAATEYGAFVGLEAQAILKEPV